MQQEEYFHSISQSIASMLEEKTLAIAKERGGEKDYAGERLFYKRILKSCPLVKSEFYQEQDSTTLCITAFCKTSFHQEVGRFITDFFGKWLLPGKTIPLHQTHSATVSFKKLPKRSFFFHEMYIEIKDEQDLKHIQANMEGLINELRVNILAVSHARRVVSVKTLTEDQKKIIIQENISELLELPSKGHHQTLFEQMQHFFLKASSEEKIDDLKKTLSPLPHLRPDLFERDLFQEVQRFMIFASKEFMECRSLSHVGRVISYSYLFKKRASHALTLEPDERFVTTKLLRTRLKGEDNKKGIIGLLATINFSTENENFDERDLFLAAATLIPESKLVPGSTIHNKREYSRTRVLYLEIEKEVAPFTSKEIDHLQKTLHKEILSRLDSVTDTLFMPRNEEEVMRNILTLGSQLRFPTDLPQVMINFSSQEKKTLTFTVLLVRIEHPGLPVIKASTKIFKRDVWINEKEEKVVGLVRKKIHKKAYILEICCHKKPYLRKDYSLDLTRARRDVYNYISNVAGEVRDFNGGMISKQNEVLIEFKRMLLESNYADDFFLENFFYSFTPRFMQCLLPPTALKHSFNFLCEAEEHDFNERIYFMKTITWEKYMIITVSTINGSFKDFIEERVSLLEFDPSSLATSYTNLHDIPTLSYILNFSDPIQADRLLKTLVEGVKEWKASLN